MKNKREYIKNLIEELSGNKVLDNNQKFIEDFGFDSLDTLTFVVRLENELGFEIDDEDAERLHTVSELFQHLKI